MADSIKLHEVVALRKGIKSRSYAKMTQLHKLNQKPALFQGMKLEFQPLDDDGETFPSESKRVQHTAKQAIEEVQERSEYWDIELTQCSGNQQATEDVVVEGEVIMANVPVTYLIFLEKELQDMHEYVSAIQTLDEDKEWDKDPNSNLYRSVPVRTHKTKKVQRPIVMYDATDKHPAQTQLITEDVTVGHWTTTYLSGALPVPEKESYLKRIRALQDGVKAARARANGLSVPRQEESKKLLKFIFG